MEMIECNKAVKNLLALGLYPGKNHVNIRGEKQNNLLYHPKQSK